MTDADAHIRAKFEDVMRKSKTISYPLGTMEINGQFHHYMDPDTDNAWIGFRAGYILGGRDAQATNSIR